MISALKGKDILLSLFPDKIILLQFSFDITDVILPNEDNELIVGVYDPTHHAGKCFQKMHHPPHILLKIASSPSHCLTDLT